MSITKTQEFFSLPNVHYADNLRCLVPPLQTQQKIGNILSSLDSKIELNKRINDNLN